MKFTYVKTTIGSVDPKLKTKKINDRIDICVTNYKAFALLLVYLIKVLRKRGNV